LGEQKKRGCIGVLECWSVGVMELKTGKINAVLVGDLFNR